MSSTAACLVATIMASLSACRTLAFVDAGMRLSSLRVGAQLRSGPSRFLSFQLPPHSPARSQQQGAQQQQQQRRRRHIQSPWRRSLVTRSMSAETSESEEVVELRADIESAGNVVRAKKAAGEDFQEAVATLKELKGKFEAITGTPFDPPKKGKKAAVGGQQQKPKQQQQQKRKNGGSGGSGAGDGSDQITPRSEDYSKWYNDVVYASDLVAQSPVRGCMVIKPWGMALWDTLREDLDRRIKESGAQNAYFPLFIPQSFLSKEGYN